MRSRFQVASEMGRTKLQALPGHNGGGMAVLSHGLDFCRTNGFARTLSTAHGVTWRAMATEFLAFKTRTIWPDVKFAVLFSVENVVL